jgi:hypothetical protein
VTCTGERERRQIERANFRRKENGRDSEGGNVGREDEGREGNRDGGRKRGRYVRREDSE